jgi:hypothetical protein
VKPIHKGDLESLLAKMDNQDGVTHRGQDLRDRVKKQKKAAREKKQILKKNRLASRLASLPALTVHPQSSNALIMESRQ